VACPSKRSRHIPATGGGINSNGNPVLAFDRRLAVGQKWLKTGLQIAFTKFRPKFDLFFHELV
jgi:hypothetical protein